MSSRGHDCWNKFLWAVSSECVALQPPTRHTKRAIRAAGRGAAHRVISRPQNRCFVMRYCEMLSNWSGVMKLGVDCARHGPFISQSAHSLWVHRAKGVAPHPRGAW